MLCHLCEPFLTDLLNQDFVNWRHVEPGWYKYKHGDHYAIQAAADACCEMCNLFNTVRSKRIRDYEGLSEKWLLQASSVDYKHEHDRQQARAKSFEQLGKDRARWTFHLLTVLPEIIWLPFELFNPKLPSLPPSHIETESSLPYTVSSTPDAPVAVEVASSWLNDCLTSHSHCARSSPVPLPTRVLDISPSGDSFNLRLQVNKDQQGQYVTLSHCWGSRRRLTLNHHNLADFQKAVPFELLPPTFADAVRLTAALGQRYLWIDALCIVQGDQEDWRREAASMCAVFENALFSISALIAEDSHSGLLQDRQSAQTIFNIGGIDAGVREQLPSLEEALRKSKLETRAWCLQERLLSPRILHVAPGQLHWECRTYVMSETTPSNGLKKDSGEPSQPFTATRRPAALHVDKKDDDHHAHWLDLVAGYSARDLTNPSDRLPAISGLAKKAKRELGLGSYTHGLWLDNMLAGLIWRRKRTREVAKANESANGQDNDVLGPSWSWASSIGTIDYPLLEGQYEHQPNRLELVLKRQHREDTQEGRGRNARTLSVIGRIKRGSCRVPAKLSTPNEAMFKSSGSLLSDDGLPCFLDEVDEPVSRGCYCLFVAMFEQAPLPKQKARQKQQCGYLILERVQRGETSQSVSDDVFGSFKRIGMGFHWPGKVESVFANAERRRLELT